MNLPRGAAAFCAAFALVAAQRGPVIATDAGRVAGERVERGAVFRGIPFGASTGGEARWRGARPVARWRGVRDATAFGPACPQATPAGQQALPQSEDCLSLNVVTPRLTGGKLPVLVVIHGGAYAFGSNRYVTDQGLSPLLRKGVVLVTPNYRVGRMGFLAHPALTAEAGHGTGNFWLSDQILALRWVRRNIARFGGDPAQVTILGCSAGGSSVNALMASTTARGLFQRAAAHSAGGLFNANRPLASAEQQGLAFARRAGASTLAELRALSVAQVLAADSGPPDYGAIVDGHLLTAPLSETFARGQQARVPFITGSTSNEASVFGLMGFDAAVMRSRFGIELDALRPAYSAQHGLLSEAELLRRVQTDFLFTSAAMAMGGFHSRVAPAWTYHFAWVPPAHRVDQPGAPHCADMPYLFGPQPADDPASRALAGQWREYWHNFIAHGDPNASELPPWPRTRPGQRTPLVAGARVEAVDGFGGGVLPVWFERWKSASGIAVDP